MSNLVLIALTSPRVFLIKYQIKVEMWLGTCVFEMLAEGYFSDEHEAAPPIVIRPSLCDNCLPAHNMWFTLLFC